MKNLLINEIMKRYGTVKRARDCFLYTAKGVRLTDLYMEGGRAVLGWGKGSAVTVFKNVLERKLLGTYFETDFSPKISDEKNQLAKAVSQLFGEERKVFAFYSKSEAEKTAESAGEKACTFIPWNQENIDWREKNAIVMAPPFPFGDFIWILAVKPDVNVNSENSTFRIPAPLCAAFTRSIYDLIRELQNREEKNWFIYDTVVTKYWTRKGPYLFPKVPESKYEDFMIHCLENELVISPDYNVPSIIPFGADKGNFSKLKNNPFEF